MPCVKIIDSIKIFIYSRDHNPPHFHALYAEYEELIIIEDLTTYSGELPLKHRRKVIAWAEVKKDFLKDQWQKFNKN